MRRAKIVCTLGPATQTAEKIAALIDAGMNMARLNLSHGATQDHQKSLTLVRDVAARTGKTIAVMADLQGPKIRLTRFTNGPHELSRGDISTITTDDVDGTKERAGTTHKGLPADCHVGDRILIDDGKVMVEVVEVKYNDVITRESRQALSAITRN
jgi:pyruvate kinase